MSPRVEHSTFKKNRNCLLPVPVSSSPQNTPDLLLLHQHMQKLLPWRCQTLNPPSILYTYRSIYKESHSSFDDLYDPPFTKTLESDNRKTSSPKTLDSEKDPKLPLRSGLPFDFRYSYSESDPSIEPIGFREPPRFSPFGPGRLDRKWNGVSAPVTGDSDPGRVLAERESVLGDPLMEEEVEEIVERYRHSDCARQINIGILSHSLPEFLF